MHIVHNNDNISSGYLSDSRWWKTNLPYSVIRIPFHRQIYIHGIQDTDTPEDIKNSAKTRDTYWIHDVFSLTNRIVLVSGVSVLRREAETPTPCSLKSAERPVTSHRPGRAKRGTQYG